MGVAYRAYSQTTQTRITVIYAFRRVSVSDTVECRTRKKDDERIIHAKNRFDDVIVRYQQCEIVNEYHHYFGFDLSSTRPYLPLVAGGRGEGGIPFLPSHSILSSPFWGHKPYTARNYVPRATFMSLTVYG